MNLHESCQQVSGYGFEGFEGDANDNFIVEIDEEDGHGGANGSGWGGDRESAKRLRTLRTRFKLRHQYTGCYLFSHKVRFLFRYVFQISLNLKITLCCLLI